MLGLATLGRRPLGAPIPRVVQAAGGGTFAGLTKTVQGAVTVAADLAQTLAGIKSPPAVVLRRAPLGARPLGSPDQQYGPVTGFAAPVMANMTGASAATDQTNVTVTPVLGNLASTSAGAVALKGSASPTLGALVPSLLGGVSVQAALANTLGGLVLTANQKVTIGATLSNLMAGVSYTALAQAFDRTANLNAVLGDSDITNLVQWTESLYTTAHWVVAAGATSRITGQSPFGGDVTKLVADTTSSNHVSQSGTQTLIPNATYNLSIFLKAAEDGVGQLSGQGANGFGGTAYCNFDLVNGVLGNKGANALNARMDWAGNGWWRCSFDAVAGATTLNGRSLLYQGTGNNTALARAGAYTGDGVSGLYACCPQMTLGAGLRPYVPNDTAGTTTKSGTPMTIVSAAAATVGAAMTNAFAATAAAAAGTLSIVANGLAPFSTILSNITGALQVQGAANPTLANAATAATSGVSIAADVKRGNLLQHSNFMLDAESSTANITVTHGLPSPDGRNEASLLQEITTATRSSASINLDYEVIGKTVTVQAWVRKETAATDAEASLRPVRILINQTVDPGVNFNAFTGALNTVGPVTDSGVVDMGVQPDGQGWWVVWFTAALDNTASSLLVYPSYGNDNADTGYVNIWHMGVREGPFTAVVTERVTGTTQGRTLSNFTPVAAAGVSIAAVAANAMSSLAATLLTGVQVTGALARTLGAMSFTGFGRAIRRRVTTILRSIRNP